MPDNSKDDPSKDGQIAGQKEQAEKQKNTDQDQSGESIKFTPEQQAEINRMLAADRRKNKKTAEDLKAELDKIKTKDLPEAQRLAAEKELLEKELAKFKSKELAESIADDLKIPKAEQPKYLKYITATDEPGIKDQLKQLRKDFGTQQVGAGSNPAKTKEGDKNTSINRFIRSKSGRVTI